MKHILSILLLVACGQKPKQNTSDKWAEIEQLIKHNDSVGKILDSIHYYQDQYFYFRTKADSFEIAYLKTDNEGFLDRRNILADSANKYVGLLNRIDNKQ